MHSSFSWEPRGVPFTKYALLYHKFKDGFGVFKIIRIYKFTSRGSSIFIDRENDIEEDDWEIDKLSNVQAQVNNQTDVVVNTILESPVGNHVYGKDVKRKISFSNNDIDVVKYEENVEQKCDILLSLNRGDVPELPAFGKNVQIGKNSGTYNYTELIKDLNNVFLQDDLFSSIGVESIELVEGDIYAKCSIKTKYSYSTVKSIKI